MGNRVLYATQIEYRVPAGILPNSLALLDPPARSVWFSIAICAAITHSGRSTGVIQHLACVYLAHTLARKSSRDGAYCKSWTDLHPLVVHPKLM